MIIDFDAHQALDIDLTAMEQQALRHRREIERRNHARAMDRIRSISMCPPPAPSNHWLARLVRCVVRWL